MRLNIYSQELTSDVELVSKAGTNANGEAEMFNGVRMYLVSPDALHHTPIDDDRSAITLWLPKSSNRRQALVNALYEMSQIVEREIR